MIKCHNFSTEVWNSAVLICIGLLTLEKDNIYKSLDFPRMAINNSSITPHLPGVLMAKVGFSETSMTVLRRATLPSELPLSIRWYYYNKDQNLNKADPFSVWFHSLVFPQLFYSVTFLKEPTMDIVIRENNAPLNSICFLRWN